MDNNVNMQQRPLLKKVKRPINRMPQSAPLTSYKQEKIGEQKSPVNNPFIQQTSQPSLQNSLPDVDTDAFNLDAYLDDDRLPAASLNEPIKNDKPQFLRDDDLQEEYAPVASGGADLPPYFTKKILIMLGAVLFFLGIVTAKLFFTDSKVVRDGLQGVVVNPEVPKGRARCGVAERTQGCVLYIMNPQRQELNARDFYDLASQMTGRQRFVIETGNMRYSNAKIRPGSIAQINIPPL